MAKKTRIAVNGFGRIGRSLFRLLLNHPQIEIAVINDLADAKTLSHLLKYDSVHGVLQRELSYQKNSIIVDGKAYPLTHQTAIESISWEGFDVDLVVECTGKFKTRQELEHHLKCGPKKVILSVPPKDDSIKTIVLGVNEGILDGSETIISNASCTTNNAAPMLKVVHDEIGRAHV